MEKHQSQLAQIHFVKQIPCGDFFLWGGMLVKIYIYFHVYLGVSKNRGTPKWMVHNGKTLLKMDDLGGKPTILGNTHLKIALQSSLHNWRPHLGKFKKMMQPTVGIFGQSKMQLERLIHPWPQLMLEMSVGFPKEPAILKVSY